MAQSSVCITSSPRRVRLCGMGSDVGAASSDTIRLRPLPSRYESRLLVAQTSTSVSCPPLCSARLCTRSPKTHRPGGPRHTKAVIAGLAGSCDADASCSQSGTSSPLSRSESRLPVAQTSTSVSCPPLRRSRLCTSRSKKHRSVLSGVLIACLAGLSHNRIDHQISSSYTQNPEPKTQNCLSKTLCRH
jgi:hypothetical protein